MGEPNVAEPITLQKFINADIDTDTWGEYVNADKMVNSRKGLSYPSAAMQARINTQKGLLPANVFDTKAAMIASALPNDSYALVTLDPNIEDNGNYRKIAGAWVYLKWNPIMTAVGILDKGDATSAQSGFSVDAYLRDLAPVSGNEQVAPVTVGLNKYTGSTDPTLQTGYVGADFNYDYTVASGKVGLFDIPANMTHIAGFNLKYDVYFAFVDKLGVGGLGGGLSSTLANIEIPPGATQIVLPVVFNFTISQDFATNLITFKNSNLTYRGNKFLRINDILGKNAKPSVKSSNYLLSALPNYSTAIPISASANDYNVGLFLGTVNKLGSVVNIAEAITAKIPIPKDTVSLDIDLSTYMYAVITDKNLNGLRVCLSSERNIMLPLGSTFLLLSVKLNAFEANLSVDKVNFYYDRRDYVLNDTLGARLVKDTLVSGAGKIMLADKQYSINGFDFRLYKASLFSGYCPKSNFSIELTGVARDRGAFGTVMSAGAIKVSIYDIHRNLVDEKTTTVFSKPMPTAIKKPLSPANKLQVLFIGDSLIWNNKNAIGKEWLRMLNTAPDGELVVDGIRYPEAFGLGGGNIELVGSKQDLVGTKYETANKLTDVMEKSDSSNPFYNINSEAENTIGADGWHNRVDLVNYFQSVCGVGKYPRYIYLASGVNDIVDLKWDISAILLVKDRMRALLGKIKQACDTIVDGQSDVQILLMNHQFYPCTEGQFSDYSPQRQRTVWAEHYKNYEKMVASDTVNGKRLNTYVRFVDCASSFDIEHGYSYETATANPRNTQTTKLVVDPVHMGESGACMYADALLRDFLYHECL